MKKILSIMMAVVLVAFSFTSCKDKKKTEPETPVIAVTITQNVALENSVADYGYWVLDGENEEYHLILSNLNNVDQIAGTYAAADLDGDYSYLTRLSDEKTIAFVEGSIKLIVEREGDKITAAGDLVGEDGNTYRINMVYEVPENPNATVVHNFTTKATMAHYASYGEYYVAISDAQFLLSLDIFADDLAGSFSSKSGDFYDYYTWAAYVENGDTTFLEAYSVKADVQSTATGYDFAVDFFAKDTILYKFTFSYEKPHVESTEVISDLQDGSITDLGILGQYFYGFQYYCQAANADSSRIVTFALNSISGTLTADDLNPDYSAIWVNKEYKGIYEAEIAVANPDSNRYEFSGWALCDNNVKYEISMVAFLIEEDESSYAPARDANAAKRAFKQIPNVRRSRTKVNIKK